MRAVYASKQNSADPLAALAVGEMDAAAAPPGWTQISMRAAALNHHDLFSLQGVGLPEKLLPMVLGTDAAGIDPEGNEVIVHAVINEDSWRGDDTLDPHRSLLSEKYPGTLAETVWVPAHNMIAKPQWLSMAEAACLPTAYLTAYRMLFHCASVRPGQRVLVQGVGGGVATAAIQLAKAAGAHVIATSRSEEKRDYARTELAADEVVAPGERIGRVDAVIETVGEATWEHSIRSVASGGVVVVAGATTGPRPQALLEHIFFRSIRVVGTTMGTRDQLKELVAMLEATGVRPRIDSHWQFADDSQVISAFSRLNGGTHLGKVVLGREKGKI